MYPVRRFVFLFVLIGLAECFHGDLFAQQSSGDKPVLYKVVIRNDSVLWPARNSRDNKIIFNRHIVLSKHQNDISFEISDSVSCMYRFFLEGFDRNQTPWQTNRIKEYTNLSAGNYVFRAEYRIADSTTGRLRPVAFRVLPHWYSSSPAILIYVLLVIILTWAVYDQLKYRFARTRFMLEQIINTRTEELIIEKEKTENLLTNVLPKNTADEIMSKGKATKIKYNFVTVLFSDIQGFTKIAEEMNPEVLIDELDKFFFHFDSVVEKYGIEKIKTIGDAYMCAGGIPEKNRTNPVEVILAALEMQQYMENLKASSELSGMRYWDIRIGIHTGTVVAGVVGQKKLSYDIWGDTVNTASRMESSGEAGKINISGTTYEFVRDFFICEYRGKMPVKYKGEIDMYFVNGIVDKLRNDNNGPNGKFLLKMQKIKLQDVEEYVIKMFDDEAPPDLYFHNSGFMKSVCSQVDLLSTAEQLPDEEYICLRLASMFLFTGYISDYNNAANSSCAIAEEVMPGYGFSETHLEKTKKLITNCFSGRQESISEMILFDATLDYLGRVDYIRLVEKLLKEETQYGRVTDRKSWIQKQRKLLSDHEFSTKTAKLLRSVSSEDQISALIDFSKELN
jgi:adenylate cyclase